MNSLLLLVFVMVVAACERMPAPRPAAAEEAPVQGDTLRAMPDMIARFQAALPHRARSFDESAARSRDELVVRFAAAVEANDAGALRSLRLDVAEFGWLYFPDSRFARPPYELPPETLWLLIEQNGLKGETRLLRHYGGEPLRIERYMCEAEPISEGANRLWEQCRVARRVTDGALVEERLFGSIIERGGRFKFVSLANRL